ncbi:unnamed protein product [Closterium sp. Naga37s-1]|nr:unnamed protein product [Closterium sp. Naga37s-1]
MHQALLLISVSVFHLPSLLAHAPCPLPCPPTSPALRPYCLPTIQHSRGQCLKRLRGHQCLQQRLYDHSPASGAADSPASGAADSPAPGAADSPARLELQILLRLELQILLRAWSCRFSCAPGAADSPAPGAADSPARLELQTKRGQKEVQLDELMSETHNNTTPTNSISHATAPAPHLLSSAAIALLLNNALTPLPLPAAAPASQSSSMHGATVPAAQGGRP